MIAIHCLEEQQIKNRDFPSTAVSKHAKNFCITKQLLTDLPSVQSSPTRKKQSKSIASEIVTLETEICSLGLGLVSSKFIPVVLNISYYMKAITQLASRNSF